jgi:hypothetical protein
VLDTTPSSQLKARAMPSGHSAVPLSQNYILQLLRIADEE